MPKSFSKGLQANFVLPAENRFGISVPKAADLKKLYEELPYAAMRAADTLRTDGTPLEGPALQRFLDEEENVANIIQQIQQILHPTGKS
jgi:hypothetical protein